MKLALSLTGLVLLLGGVALYSTTLASRAKGVASEADAPTVVFGSGVGVLSLTAGFLLLRIRPALRRG